MVSPQMTLQAMNGIYTGRCSAVHNAVPRPQKNQSVHTFKCLCPLLTQHRFYYTQEKKNNFHGTLEISVVESML